MIVHFIEVTQADFNLNHGKFMIGRFTAEEARTNSALPDYEHESLWRVGGLRKMRPDTTLVMDLQTGEGASFSLDPMGGDPKWQAHFHLEKHKIWVCPMFEPFLGWLYGQGLANGKGDITALPRYVEVATLEGALYGHRREGEEATA